MTYMDCRTANIRVFVSRRLAESSEVGVRSVKHAGRPFDHSGCLIIAMLGVRRFLGIGYRETCSLFEERGFARVPNFRTLQWRAERSKHLGFGITAAVSKRETKILLDTPEERNKGVERVSGATFENRMGKLGSGFVELAL